MPAVRDYDSLPAFYADYAKYEIELSKIHQPYPAPVAHRLITQIDPSNPSHEIVDDRLLLN